MQGRAFRGDPLRLSDGHAPAQSRRMSKSVYRDLKPLPLPVPFPPLQAAEPASPIRAARASPLRRTTPALLAMGPNRASARPPCRNSMS